MRTLSKTVAENHINKINTYINLPYLPKQSILNKYFQSLNVTLTIITIFTIDLQGNQTRYIKLNFMTTSSKSQKILMAFAFSKTDQAIAKKPIQIIQDICR
ncbi:hypothetical protein D9M68_915770 [compost metagenome]